MKKTAKQIPWKPAMLGGLLLAFFLVTLWMIVWGKEEESTLTPVQTVERFYSSADKAAALSIAGEENGSILESGKSCRLLTKELQDQIAALGKDTRYSNLSQPLEGCAETLNYWMRYVREAKLERLQSIRLGPARQTQSGDLVAVQVPVFVTKLAPKGRVSQERFMRAAVMEKEDGQWKIATILGLLTNNVAWGDVAIRKAVFEYAQGLEDH